MSDEMCGQATLCAFNRAYVKDDGLVRAFVRGVTSACAYSWSSIYDDK